MRYNTKLTSSQAITRLLSHSENGNPISNAAFTRSALYNNNNNNNKLLIIIVIIIINILLFSSF